MSDFTCQVAGYFGIKPCPWTPVKSQPLEEKKEEFKDGTEWLETALFDSRGGMFGCGPVENKEQEITEEGGATKVDSSQMFCNVEDGAEVHLPVVPLCITGPAEYQYSETDELNPVDVYVNGTEVYEYVTCDYGTFWVDVPLKKGPNTIEATINFVGAPLSSAISLDYNPDYPTGGKNLLYGIHGRYVTVIDLDEGKLVGKIGTDLEGLGPKNVVLSPDAKRLYVPREIGVEVVDTSNHKLLMKILGIETGGRAARNPGGTKLFVNRYTIDRFDTAYRVNVFSTESGNKLFDFFGGGPDFTMLIPDEKQENLYTTEGGEIKVYYSASLYESTKTIPVYASNIEADPQGEKIVAVSSTVTVIDTKTDEIDYYFESLNGATSAAFSPDGEVVYLGSYDSVKAHRFSDQATLWEADLSDIDYDLGATALTIDPQGKKLYGLNPSECGAEVVVIDAASGKLLDRLPAVPIAGEEIEFKPAQ